MVCLTTHYFPLDQLDVDANYAVNSLRNTQGNN